MNPAKRKKLYRLELQSSKEEKTTEHKVLVEEKVIQKEQTVLQQQVSSESGLEMGLKLTETVDSSDNKKDKKKKLSSQDV